jgi:hypothetical protein
VDPAQWLAEYDKRLAQMAADAETAEVQLGQVGGWATSPHGEVEVRVGPSGALEDLRLTPAARAMEADRLARLILATARQAQGAVGAQVVGIMTEYLGDGPALDLVKHNLPPVAGVDVPGGAHRQPNDDDYIPEVTQ